MDAYPTVAPKKEADIPLIGNHLTNAENWADIKQICEIHNIYGDIKLDNNNLKKLTSKKVNLGQLAEALKQFEKTYAESPKSENTEKSPAKEQENTGAIADFSDRQIRTLCGAISTIKSRER